MTANVNHNIAPNTAELSGNGVQAEIDRIHEIDAFISHETGAQLGSTDLSEVTDQFLVEAAVDTGSEEAVETALIAGALEATDQRTSSSQNPIHALEIFGSGDAISDAVMEMRDTQATLPGGENAASVIVEEVNKLESELVQRWQYDASGTLVRDSFYYYESSDKLLRQPGLIEDQEMAHTVAIEVDKVRDNEIDINTNSRQKELDKIQALLDLHGDLPPVEAAKKAIVHNMKANIDPVRITTSAREVSDAARGLSIKREQAYLEGLIQDRVESDRFPWTMSDRELPPEMLEGVKTVVSMLNPENATIDPSDEFRIPPPMQQFEGGTYAPEDESLLQKADLSMSRRGLHFKREELQKAGVFFINRVGAGEQPIFGVPIPDASSEGGVFNVQNRTFLTREEFDKVYDYQQKNGFGIGNKDPADVQLDMIMFAVRPEGRKPETRKSYGFGSRESKYGIARSPFVESSVVIGSGVEPMVYDKSLGQLRMNTMSIHLANGHPDYPGLSEMFSEDAAHDQRYMSSGEFVREFHVPLPTQQEALVSMKYPALRTKREKLWVGPLPETSRFLT